MKKMVVLLDQLFSRLLERLVQVCLVIMTAGVFIQVILRMLFKVTFLPIEDILPYSFSITTFAGSALLFKEKGHIAITFLTDSFKGGFAKIITTISSICVFVFLMIFVVIGIEFMVSGRYQFSPLLKIPLYYVFIIVPLFGVSSIVFLLSRNLKNTRKGA